MWKNLISSVASIGSAVYLYLIVAGVSGAIFGYSAYSWTSDFYVAKIEKANIDAEKKVNDIQRKGDQLVADYIQQIDKLSNNNASLQRQIAMATSHSDGSVCVVSNGFVRLYNASTTGEASSPSSADGASSGVDEATVLQVALENNDKYLKLAKKLADLQAYVSTK
jgi:hypothetical protein